MSELLIVMPFCKKDAKQCESLIDWIFQLNNRKPSGHCLLVAAPDADAEQIELVKIAASVTFNTSEAIRVHKQTVNAMFKGASKYVMDNFRFPFFWMEPDCTPLVKGWAGKLADEYHNQPKRFNGTVLKSGAETWSARCITYPNDAHRLLAGYCDADAPFNASASKIIIPALTKHGLVRELLIDSQGAYGSLPSNAVAVHGDKTGIALAARESELAAKGKGRTV